MTNESSLRQLRQDALDDDELLEALHAGLLGEEHLGHAAFGQLALERVLAELLSTAAVTRGPDGTRITA